MSNHLKSSIAKEMLESGILDIYQGNLLIWDSPGMLLPINTIILINKIKQEYPKITMDELYYQMGKMQSHRGHELLVKKYGYEPNQIFMEEGFGKSELLGMGIFEFIDFDPKNKSFTIINMTNPYAHQYLKTFGKQKHAVCHYLRGLCAGNFQPFWENTEMLAIELSCIAKGDPACVFKIIPKNKWNLKDPIVNKQIIRNRFPKKIFNDYYNWDTLVSRHAGKPKNQKDIEKNNKKLKKIIQDFKNKSL